MPQAAATGSQSKETTLQVIGDGYTQPFATDGETADAGAAPQAPHEYISSLNSQRAAEILYNFGLALFKEKKFL